VVFRVGPADGARGQRRLEIREGRDVGIWEEEEASEGRSSEMKRSPDRPCCVQRGGRGGPREERRGEGPV